MADDEKQADPRQTYQDQAPYEQRTQGQDEHTNVVPGTDADAAGNRNTDASGDSDYQDYLLWKRQRDANTADVNPAYSDRYNGASQNSNDERSDGVNQLDSGAQTRDPMLREAQRQERYSQPPEAISGEGVKTGPPLDHYVHLADGSVIEGHAGGSVYHDAERGLIPIVRTFPKGVIEDA